MVRPSQPVLGTRGRTRQQQCDKGRNSRNTANAFSVNHLSCGSVRKCDFLFSGHYAFFQMRKHLLICVDNSEQTEAFAGLHLSVLPKGLPLLRLCSSEWS